MQYFERALFEFHPENQASNRVKLTPLGALIYKQRYPKGAPNQTPSKGPGAQEFPAIGHWLGGPFLAFWRAHSGQEAFGAPISDEFAEAGPTGGQPDTVQYFAQGELELSPAAAAPNAVQVAALGTVAYQAKFPPFQGQVPAKPDGLDKIQHFVFIFQENRSFDSYFGTWPGADGQDPRDVMGWHDSREIPNYWNYAQQYVLQDHLFESVATWSLPAHLYLLAAQSGGYVLENHTDRWWTFPEITELLLTGKVSWNYYVTSGTQPDTDDGHVVGEPSQQQQLPDTYTIWNPLPHFAPVQNNPSQRSHLVDTAKFYADAKAGTLAQVSWVIPSGEVSEHPPSGVREGMAYVTGLINAVMQGPDWNSTAIFVPPALQPIQH